MNIAYNKYCNRTSKPFDTDAYLLTGGCIAKSHIICGAKAVEVGNTVFNLLEFDLGETRDIKRLTLVAKASDAAGGVFGIAFC